MCRCADVESVRELLARYVRAADYRDVEALDDIFVEDSSFEVAFNDAGVPKSLGVNHGIEAAREVWRNLPDHLGGGWGHHFSLDHIIDVDGDEATLSAHFFTTSAVPDGTLPRGPGFPAGRIIVGVTGYYDTHLIRTEDGWRIDGHRITLDLPYQPT